MSSKRIIPRATDYFGIAYYGFLTAYAIYEFILGREHISALVIGPIFYTFVIYGLLQLLIIPFITISSLISKDKGGWEQIKTSFGIGLLSLLLAIWIADGYLNPRELASLTETGSLILMLIILIEILFRILFSQSPKNGKLTFLERLKRVDDFYPMGLISFVGIFMGAVILVMLYAPASHDLRGVVLFGGIVFTVNLLLLDWINQKLSKSNPVNDDYDEPIPNAAKRGVLLFQREKPRRWALWISLLAAFISTFIIYSVLSMMMSSITTRRLFILAFAFVYALLAWTHAYETYQSNKHDMEIPY